MATAELERHCNPSLIPAPPPDGLELLERRHVAFLLGESVQYVDALRAAGVIPGSVKGIGGKGRGRKFIRSKIEAWIEAGCPRPAKR